MGAEFRLGIQSYCFRKFKPLSALLDCLKQVGLEYVEVFPGHLHFQKDSRAAIEGGLQAIKDAGIRIESYGAVNLGADEEFARNYLEFSRFAGVKATTVVDIAPEALDMMGRLCDEYDVNLAVHNHGRDRQFGSYASLEELFSRTSPRFGLCLDAAWALDAGEDPVAGVERFADRLYGVHLKDFTFDAEGRPQDVIIGRGGLDLPLFMQRLKDIGFNGYLSLEYEGNPDDPMDEVRECVRVVQDVIAGL